VWGGNRTDAGAFAQSVLTSILTTCRQRTVDTLDWLANALRATTPLPLLGGGR
jgi:transposase